MKRIMTHMGVFCAAALLATACGTSGKLFNAGVGPEGKWKIQQIDNEKITDVEKEPFIQFDAAQKRVNGTAGCNNFFGGYTYTDGGKLKFSDNMGATRMMCPNMKFEDKLFQTLPKVERVAYQKGKLVLKDAQGNDLVVLVK